MKVTECRTVKETAAAVGSGAVCGAWEGGARTERATAAATAVGHGEAGVERKSV